MLGAVLVIPAACGGRDAANAHETQALMLTGSSTLAPLAAEIGRRFEAERGAGVHIDVQTGGSSRGIMDVKEGRADIGMTSRALVDAERGSVEVHVIAWDGVGFVVHADNPVSGLTDDELRGIFEGRIQDWREVGGEAGEIVVVNRAAGRSELDLVLEYWGAEPKDIVAHVIGAENQQVVKTIAANPRAISYLSIGTSEYEIGRGTKLRLLPLGGVEASSANVRSGLFPLARPLIMLAPEGASALAHEFIEYAEGAGVHDLIRAQFFVPAG